MELWLVIAVTYQNVTVKIQFRKPTGDRMPDAIATVKVQEARPKTDTEAINRYHAPPEQLPKALVARMATYLIFLSLVLIYLLMKVWPGTMPLGSRSTVALGWNGRLQIELWIESRYLLIVVLSSAIGSYIHLATSFADFVGNRRLKPSWEVWYLLRPFIGSTLAIIVYFVVRAGFIGSSGAEQMSPYGIAATAGMCGLFSKQATDKLEAVFEEAFRTKEKVKRKDPLATEPTAHSGKT
jgi:hypothetical protein